jgi:hypothetical protein
LLVDLFKSYKESGYVRQITFPALLLKSYGLCGDCNVLQLLDVSVSAPKTCGAFEFTCRDGSCVDLRRVCDRRRDCRDGSDEDNCGKRSLTLIILFFNCHGKLHYTDA